MAMDVSKANMQASRLNSYSGDLDRAIAQLQVYKNSITVNYDSREVGLIIEEIDCIIILLHRARDKTNSLGYDIRYHAMRIREQELERIRRAQNALNSAKAALDRLLNQQRIIRNQLQYATNPDTMANLSRQLSNLSRQVNNAQRNYNSCYAELQAAKR